MSNTFAPFEGKMPATIDRQPAFRLLRTNGP
jgi:hypothetical protein